MHAVSKRTPHLYCLALAIASLTIASPAVVYAGSTAKPNVIFILADDLGWGDLGCYGHPHICTPHLDRLAAQGTRFTQFYVNGSVCSPSRAAFMTGQFPARHRIHGHLATHQLNVARSMPDWLDPQVPLVTRVLKQAGYRTAHFGKWHLGDGPDAPGPGAYAVDDHRTVVANGPGFERANDPYFHARSTGMFVDETIRFVEQHRNEPFYVNLWTLVPHAPLNPTPEQLKPYARLAPPRVSYPSTEQVYYASVTALDQELGRLFQKLDELGLTEHTLVIFSSDNGPEDIHIRNASHSGVGSPGPFRGRKRSLYDGGIRMPLIVRWPGQVPADRLDETSVISAVDFLPTLCSLAGGQLPTDYRGDGEDVSDILRGASRPRNSPLFWEWRFLIAGYPVNHSPMLSVREGGWSLLLNPDRSRVELYDAVNDRMQLDNQAAAHPEIVERLAEKVLAWHKALPPGPVEASAGTVHYGWPVGKSGSK